MRWHVAAIVRSRGRVRVDEVWHGHARVRVVHRPVRVHLGPHHVHETAIAAVLALALGEKVAHRGATRPMVVMVAVTMMPLVGAARSPGTHSLGIVLEAALRPVLAVVARKESDDSMPSRGGNVERGVTRRLALEVIIRCAGALPRPCCTQ